MHCDIDWIIGIISDLGISENIDFSEDIVDEFVGKICDKYDFSYNTGISKLVLKPKEKDYVIKIPFTRWFDEEYGEYYNFTCYGDREWNSCEYEQWLYEKAKSEGFNTFFLPIELIGVYRGYPIYIQPKVEVCYDNQEDYHTEKNQKTKEFLKNKNVSLMSEPVESWFNMIYDIIKDDNRFNEFLDFLNKFEITEDLHEANIGIYKNTPVIIDYAGFDK